MMLICEKCKCNNQFGAIFCRNCGTALKIKDENHPFVQKSKKTRKIIFRLFKLIIAALVIFLLAGLFLPFGFSPRGDLSNVELIGTIKKFQEMSNVIAGRKGKKMYCFTPVEAGYIITYLYRIEETPQLPDNAKKAKRQGPADDNIGDAYEAAKTVCFEPLADEKINIVLTETLGGIIKYRLELKGTIVENKENKSIGFAVESAKVGHFKVPERFVPLAAKYAGNIFVTKDIRSYCDNFSSIKAAGEKGFEVILK